jgi:hypothetical protein
MVNDIHKPVLFPTILDFPMDLRLSNNSVFSHEPSSPVKETKTKKITVT